METTTEPTIEVKPAIEAVIEEPINFWPRPSKPPLFVPIENGVYTDGDLRKIREDLWLHWDEYLKQHGVKEPMPHKLKGKYNVRALALHYLRNYMGQWITKEDGTEFIRKFVPDATDVQDFRHLGRQEGWNIEQDGTGKYKLINLIEVHPQYHAKRRLGDLNWDGILKFWKNRCACCGAVDGQPHWKPYYENIVVKLDKSHCDPNLPMTDDNVIPMCQCCNRAAQDKFIFDKATGLPKSANPKARQTS